MFSGLRHEAFICCDNQQGKVDTAGTCQHVFNKFFVSRHVDDTGFFSIRKIQISKAQLDGDTALLFFLDAVGFDSGQSFDEGGFAVVNVTGSSNNNIFHSQSFFLYGTKGKTFCPRRLFMFYQQFKKIYFWQHLRMLSAT